MISLNFNKAADFWRKEIGANVYPFNSQKKETYVEWGEFEEKPVSKDQLDTRVRTIIED
jgi:hypothetical protein